MIKILGYPHHAWFNIFLMGFVFIQVWPYFFMFLKWIFVVFFFKCFHDIFETWVTEEEILLSYRLEYII